jgi:internalin A
VHGPNTIKAVIKSVATSGRTHLDLTGQGLSSLPAEIGRLSNLEVLTLSRNELTSLPAEIGRLSKLRSLLLTGNRLTSIPPEIASLSSLTNLVLSGNFLTSLPNEFSQLSSLVSLDLSDNEFEAVPLEIIPLSKLRILKLSRNKLKTLSLELGKLSALTTLELEGNVLVEPPPAILSQGMRAILGYLQARALDSRQQWMSKLMVVGEGGVGKTSLLRALQGEQYNPQEPTTHGLRVSNLALNHPDMPGITMQLRAWDFGGQQIYQATHQFFLTDRSLYLLVWSARIGFEQSRIYTWLDMISARAPEARILLVATSAEGRDADLPISELRYRYPKIAGSITVSNPKRTGIAKLRRLIGSEAKSLPLMGERWPAAWLGVAEQLRRSGLNSISRDTLFSMMDKGRVKALDREVLARWLHELGDILYFQDDPQLDQVIILKPEWVTEKVSRVLDSPEVVKQKGMFTRSTMDRIWLDLDRGLREHFLRLMERFDLSYCTARDRQVSIVVERLPWEPPNYQERWSGIQSSGYCKEVSMKFELGSTVPPGLPTWFIAQSHRFSTETHWRQGALLADEGQHLGLVRSDAHQRCIWLTVRGPSPHNFFALLRDGLESTIERYPGLKVFRKVPCPGHEGKPCSYEFDYGTLEEALHQVPAVKEIQCQKSFKTVELTHLLFGIHWSAHDEVLKRLDQLDAAEEKRHRELMGEVKELRELAQREFLALFRREQRNVDTYCPNVFVLTPSSTLLTTLAGRHGRSFLGDWEDRLGVSSLYLQLCCQVPGSWHPVGEPYHITSPPVWLREMAPYIRRMASVLKYAAPAVGHGVGTISTAVDSYFRHAASFTRELSERIEATNSQSPGNELLSDQETQNVAEGAELRAIRHLLEELDPSQVWGGLRKTWTPEGHCLWLCPQHGNLITT